MNKNRTSTQDREEITNVVMSRDDRRDLRENRAPKNRVHTLSLSKEPPRAFACVSSRTGDPSPARTSGTAVLWQRQRRRIERRAVRMTVAKDVPLHRALAGPLPACQTRARSAEEHGNYSVETLLDVRAPAAPLHARTYSRKCICRRRHPSVRCACSSALALVTDSFSSPRTHISSARQQKT